MMTLRILVLCVIGFHHTLFVVGLPTKKNGREATEYEEKRRQEIRNILGGLEHQGRHTKKEMEAIRDKLDPIMVKILMQSLNMKEIVFVEKNEEFVKRKLLILLNSFKSTCVGAPS